MSKKVVNVFATAILASFNDVVEAQYAQGGLAGSLVQSILYGELMSFVDERESVANRPLLAWALDNVPQSMTDIDVAELVERASTPRDVDEQAAAFIAKGFGAKKKEIMDEMKRNNEEQAQRVQDVAEQAQAHLQQFLDSVTEHDFGEPVVDEAGALRIIEKWKSKLNDFAGSRLTIALRNPGLAGNAIAEKKVVDKALKRIDKRIEKLQATVAEQEQRALAA